MWESIEHGSSLREPARRARQEVGRDGDQRSEIRDYPVGAAFSRDSNNFYGFYDFYDFYDFTNRLLTTGFLFVVVHAAQLLPVVPRYRLAEKLAVTRGHVCELDTYTET